MWDSSYLGYPQWATAKRPKYEGTGDLMGRQRPYRRRVDDAAGTNALASLAAPATAY